MMNASGDSVLSQLEHSTYLLMRVRVYMMLLAQVNKLIVCLCNCIQHKKNKYVYKLN